MTDTEALDRIAAILRGGRGIDDAFIWLDEIADVVEATGRDTAPQLALNLDGEARP